MANARIAELTWGETAVDLTRVQGPSVFSVSTGGIGKLKYAPHQLHRMSSSDDALFLERWNIIAKDCTPDELREEIERFEDLLVKAWEYGHTFYQRTPVLLHVRAARETGDRYALVDSSPEIDKDSPLFNRAFDEAVLSEMGVGVLRYAWTDTPTGTLPTVEDLSARADAESAPASPVVAVRGAVGNVRHHAVGTLTDVYAFDASLAAFSGNLASTDSYDLFSVAGAVPAASDIHYFGGSRPFFTVAGYIGTPGVYSWTEVWEYWSGAAWTTLTAGTQYVLYPDATPFKTEGVWAFSWPGATGWAQTAINGVTRYWVRVRISAFTSHTTTPRNEDQRAYALQHPHIVLPSSAVQGDAPPRVLLRMRHGLGATTSVAFGLTNRILAGLKTVESDSLFEAFLNLGGLGNRIQWTTVALTDTLTSTDASAPAGQRMGCDFATDASLVTRIRLTGDGLFQAYAGRYRVFLRAQQIGGANGDIEHAVRVFLDSTSGPFVQKPAVAMRSHDLGIELIDLIPNGYLQLPFDEYQTGSDDFSQADLVIEILSELNTGSAQVFYYDLILLPVHEWVGEWEDPVSDPTTGSSSLRGASLLEEDGGVLLDRTIKQLVSGSQLFPAETWTRRGLPVRLRPNGDENRLYFLSARFGSSFGAAPLLSEPGEFLLIELYLHNVYRDLRGDD